MDQRTDVENTVREHRRSPWRPWSCACGRRMPCHVRQDAVRQLIAWNSRPLERQVVAKLRLRAKIDRVVAQRINQRHPWPTGPTSTWPPR